MLGRGDEQIDVPGSGRKTVWLRLAPPSVLVGVRIADRLAAALDDAAERSLAPHGQRDLGFRASRVAPPGLHLGIGEPSAHAEAVFRLGWAELDCQLIVALAHFAYPRATPAPLPLAGRGRGRGASR